MIGDAVLGISTFWVTEEYELLDRLPPEALRRFAEGLALLDQNISEVGPSFHSEAVHFARSLQGDPDQAEQAIWSTDAWRYGFSNRMMLATTGLQRLDLVDRVTAAAGGWAACEKYFSLRGDEDGANANLRGALRTRFHTITKLRLLRMAIDYALGRTILELPDPFGKTLHHAIDSEGKARFWSAGPEGRQDLFLFSRSGS